MCCCFIFFPHQIIYRVNILCLLINVWKVMLTHLCRPIIFVRRKHCESGKILVLGAKYWLSTSWWSDEGSSEGTMTQLEGNPKNPDNLLNLLYCPRLAGWLLGEHCISWMPAVQWYSMVLERIHRAANGWWVHMSMLGRVYCAPSSPPTSPLSASRWHHCNIIESHHVCVSLCEEYIAV